MWWRFLKISLIGIASFIAGIGFIGLLAYVVISIPILQNILTVLGIVAIVLLVGFFLGYTILDSLGYFDPDCSVKKKSHKKRKQ